MTPAGLLRWQNTRFRTVALVLALVARVDQRAGEIVPGVLAALPPPGPAAETQAVMRTLLPVPLPWAVSLT